MNIGSIGAAYTSSATHVRPRPEIHETTPGDSQAKSVSNETVPTAAESTAEMPPEAQKGVLRNLLAGHFKGVADVRLRINFHDELTRIEQAARSASIEGQPEMFVGIARDGLELIPADLQFPETFETTVAEVLTGYEDSVQTAFAEFSAQPTVSRETLTGSLQAAFNAFVGSLEQSLAEPVESEETESGPIVARDAKVATAETAARAPESEESSEIPQASTDTDEPFDLAQFIADLTATFESALADLELALQSATVLPELSGPSGNGVAYNKHLAVYEAMRAPATEESPPSYQVETEA